MNEIKFDHIYEKMPEDFEKSILLETFVKPRCSLGTWFVRYDTAICDGNHYELPPHGRVLVLLLISEGGEVWTTIRRHTDEKEAYYRRLRGSWVRCVVKAAE